MTSPRWAGEARGGSSAPTPRRSGFGHRPSLHLLKLGLEVLQDLLHCLVLRVAAGSKLEPQLERTHHFLHGGCVVVLRDPEELLQGDAEVEDDVLWSGVRVVPK
eukprot:CAMPEP_0119135410 /NCGR_PEP_ID=MMETSP1310-20130426/19237_1 /TAXON_ID=464262 /ORGANISM="Genus nov. species nov., Strain RCC2339" /LENGTH=103 /DNA_ID=CAMNT_0007126293 /DNA_START=96 /DNA_END=404 /DNA_ORIENTATION=-